MFAPPGALRRWVCVCAFGFMSTGVAAEPRTFYVEDIKSAMDSHIAASVDEEGIFHLRDDRTGEMLALRFVKIHDPVRRIDADTYFACTDFSVQKDEDQLYDIDFWLRPENGVLVVYDTKVHKEPRRSLLYGWYKQPRYTFVDDKVVELY
ncbi:MAG TPA: hypothetical protein DCR65_08965 [Gammaproteobacteria bacterium]|jgi:hypothetical protein|nr:hypothetical protein [Gammaproteobacteria bacterium]